MMHTDQGDRNAEAEHRIELLFGWRKADYNQGIDPTLKELMLE